MEFLTFSGLTFVPCCNKVISSQFWPWPSRHWNWCESPTTWGLHRIYSSKVVVQFWEKTEHRRDNGIGENLWPEGDLRVQAWPQLLFNLAKQCEEKHNITMRCCLKLCELLSVALIRSYWQESRNFFEGSPLIFSYASSSTLYPCQWVSKWVSGQSFELA